jgi:hypothetical protein
VDQREKPAKWGWMVGAGAIPTAGVLLWGEIEIIGAERAECASRPGHMLVVTPHAQHCIGGSAH